MIITSLVILLALVGPIIYFNGMKSRAEKKITTRLVGLAIKNNNKIDEYDFLEDAAIGVDKESKKLFYVDIKQKVDIVIDLKVIKYCNTALIPTNVMSFQPLYLILEPLNKASGNIKINFYDPTKVSSSPLQVIPLLKKWSEIVNATIAYI